MELSKTDLRNTIRYLEGAVKVYAGLPKLPRFSTG